MSYNFRNDAWISEVHEEHKNIAKEVEKTQEEYPCILIFTMKILIILEDKM